MLPLVTLAVVFCYITSKITTHTEGNDDPEHSYYVLFIHVCESRCIPKSEGRTA